MYEKTCQMTAIKIPPAFYKTCQMTANMICGKCGNEWIYRGSNNRTTCSRCNHSITIESTRKHFVKLDLKKFGKDIASCLKLRDRVIIFDCLGEDVVNVSSF